jgi:DNA-binding transcriptional LysR family regulator
MPDKKLARRQILDPTVADLLSDMESKQAEAMLPRREREKRARERAKIQARRERRVTYDLPPAVRQIIEELAEHERIPASQVVSLALARFLQDLDQGKVDLSVYKQPSRSPRYDWNLVLPEEIMPVAGKKKKK